MLHVGRLRVLKEVAYRGSLSAAADALDYSQSAVSQQISTLEAETGMKLLERHPRGVTLTAAGQTLVGHAEAILSRIEAERIASACPTRDRKSTRLNSSHLVISYAVFCLKKKKK